MSAFFRTMDSAEAQTIQKWLEVVKEWAIESEKAVQAGSSFIDLDATVR